MQAFRFTVNGRRVEVVARNIADARRKVRLFFSQAGTEVADSDIELLTGPLQTPIGRQAGDISLPESFGEEPADTAQGGDDDLGDIGLQRLVDRGITDATQPFSDVSPIPEPSDPTARNPLLGPGTQFRQALRARGIDPDGFAGQRFGRFQTPALSLFDIGTATGTFGAPANPDVNNPFQRAIDTGLLQTLPSNAINTFRDLVRGAGGDRSAVFSQAIPGGAGADELRDLAALALGGVTNLGFANRFGQQIVNRVANQFAEQADINPTNPETFAQAINRRLRLGA